MKLLFQTIMLLGIPRGLVCVIEFAAYRKTTESRVAATIFPGAGFGGPFIYNTFRSRK